MSALAKGVFYAARGWPVLPTRAEGKEPLTKRGVKDATTDRATIARWARRWPHANVAIACGSPGPTVLDVDELEEGADALAAVADAPMVATLRGRHAYLAGLPRATIALGYGELRGRGHYVVAPPSRVNGREYTWLALPKGRLPAVPRELLANRTTAGRGVQPVVDRVRPGAMYDHLVDLAVRCVRAGIVNPGVVERVLVAEFEAVRIPGARYGGSAEDTLRIAEWAAATRIAERERRMGERSKPTARAAKAAARQGGGAPCG